MNLYKSGAILMYLQAHLYYASNYSLHVGMAQELSMYWVKILKQSHVTMLFLLVWFMRHSERRPISPTTIPVITNYFKSTIKLLIKLLILDCMTACTSRFARFVRESRLVSRWAGIKPQYTYPYLHRYTNNIVLVARGHISNNLQGHSSLDPLLK